MRMFVWESVEGVTQNWHDGGGVLVIAETVERAKELVPRKGFTDEPDFSASVEWKEEKVFIFPDAGCC